MYAAQKGDLNMVVELIDRGADPWMQNQGPSGNYGVGVNYRFTAVDFALNEPGRYLDCVVAIIKKTKFPVDWLDIKYGCTPLMFAAQVGNLKVVEELIAGADVNMVRRSGIKTALDYALDDCDKPHLDCMMEFVRPGANCNHRHIITGMTPLMSAAKAGNLGMCKELVQLGVSVLAVNEKTKANVFSFVKGNERMDILGFLWSQTSREVVGRPVTVGRDERCGDVDKRECCSCSQAVKKLETEVLNVQKEREVESLKMENWKENDEIGETGVAEEEYVLLSGQVDSDHEQPTELVEDKEGITSANSLYSNSVDQDVADVQLDSRSKVEDGPSNVVTSLINESSPSKEVNPESSNLDKLGLNEKVVFSSGKASTEQLKDVLGVKENANDADSANAKNVELEKPMQSGEKEKCCGC
ncbi:hypothetical protein HDU76_009418 [Blyttiomyces sp. JEL0837]|nr:hypothetical protein HDU76_009418 [Blyttiomyces sp. JEL0837]